MGGILDFFEEAIETVSDVVEEVVDEVGYTIEDVVGGGYNYTIPPSYDPDPKKPADILAEIREDFKKDFKNFEKGIVNNINESMRAFIQELERINEHSFGGRSLNINIKGIRDKNEKLEGEISECIDKVIDDNLVLKNRKLTNEKKSGILDERDDEKRKNRLVAFCQELKKEALSELSSKIESSVREQEKSIRKEIENRLNEVDRSIKEVEKAYAEIITEKEKGQTEIGKIQIKYIYKYELTQILLDQLTQEGI